MSSHVSSPDQELRSRIKAYLQIVTRVTPTDDMVDRFISSFGILETLVQNLKVPGQSRQHAVSLSDRKPVTASL